MADVLGCPCTSRPSPRAAPWARRSAPASAPASTRGLHELRPGLRRRAATFEPDPAAAAAYDERYAAWREIYRRMLEITDDGLLNPLWRAAGA